MASAARPKSAGARRPAAADIEEEGQPVYPKVFYRKVKPSPRFPNGYEPRRVYDDVEEQKLVEDKAWKDTPEGMSPALPHGHRD